MRDTIEQLEFLTSPHAERLSEYDRINEFCFAGRAAVTELKRLREENAKLRRRNDLMKNTRNEELFEKLMQAHEKIAAFKARAKNEDVE